jgi:hypothetical protein
MLSGMGTVNLSQLEAAFNTDLGDQQNPLQTGAFDSGVQSMPLLYCRKRSLTSQTELSHLNLSSEAP